ncbi:MAG: SAM-dependent chlorinase/fluorinase [Armatimonadetes bacterium]|nr:SAM-dependent chlorinase/fluorinase [Armatimonadota bacterium]
MRITLLTDFGDSDGFVAAMKGVIASRAPEAVVVDLAHHVLPGDVRHAGHVLHTTAPFFPSGTCHVVVVDPGVGTARRAVAVAVGEQLYVAPDNGVLTDVLQAAAGRVVGVELTNPAFWQHPVSTTFHGRDIFAPVAAYMTLGIPITALGKPVDPATLVRLQPARLEVGPDAIHGEVTYLDIFGNAVTNLSRHLIAELAGGDRAVEVVVDDTVIGGVQTTYGSVEAGRPVALIGSCGRLEVAVNGGSAAGQLHLALGSPVTVRAV